MTSLFGWFDETTDARTGRHVAWDQLSFEFWGKEKRKKCSATTITACSYCLLVLVTSPAHTGSHHSYSIIITASHYICAVHDSFSLETTPRDTDACLFLLGQSAAKSLTVRRRLSDCDVRIDWKRISLNMQVMGASVWTGVLPKREANKSMQSDSE